MRRHLELLWVGYQTLCNREVGCLGRVDVSLSRVRSFAAARLHLARREVDVVVLSLSGEIAELPDQIAAIRALAPGAMIAAVVCHGADVDRARAAGVDEVTALESEGDLVCAPVLRWVERRRGTGDLVDLGGALRRRRALEAEIARLESEAEALRRQAVRDPATRLFGREAFITQLELAAALLAGDRRGLALVVVEIESLEAGAELFGDHIIGGALNRVTAALTEIGSGSDIAGRLAPGRFAAALFGCERSALPIVVPTLRDRLERIELPGGRPLAVDICAGHIEGSRRPGPLVRRLLDRVEGGLDVNRALA